MIPKQSLLTRTKPILVSSGEPAGIGPDLCLSLARCPIPVVVLGDKQILAERAKRLGLTIRLVDYESGQAIVCDEHTLNVISLPCPQAVVPGVLNVLNASYVIEMLTMAAERCLRGEFSALVTAPVHKSIINQAGYSFTGHTEFFADYCQANSVVMMLACDAMKVALVTTHLPLKEVAESINQEGLKAVIREVHHSLQTYFGISAPKLYVAGLNPHAGESGVLGREEIEIISPSLADLKQEGIDVQGPFSADTMFVMQKKNPCDAFVAMYHDQGLPVLKYCGFGDAVNITLGLPIIRTSVDHGTALELAGSGKSTSSSLFAAVETAALMASFR